MEKVVREWFCYMLKCRDAALYVGIASDVRERVKRHNWGVGPEFTAKRRPVELVWSELCGSADAARRREKEIKGWSRVRKLALIGQAESNHASARPSACREIAQQSKGWEEQPGTGKPLRAGNSG